MRAVSGAGNLGVGDGTNVTNLTADSISVGTLTVGAGSVVTINALPGGPTAGGPACKPCPNLRPWSCWPWPAWPWLGAYLRRK